MSENDPIDRRHFLTAAALTVAAAQLAPIAANAQSDTTTTTLTPVAGTHTSFSSMKQTQAGLLNVGYAEAGPANGTVVILLHGWPYDIHSYVDVAPILAAKGYRVIVPYLRGYGSTTFLSSTTPRNGQQGLTAMDTIALMDTLKIKRAIFGGFDWGSREAAILAALYPERCKALVAVSGYLITNRKLTALPLPPKAELGWWYQYYFSTENGVLGYTKYRHDFAKLIWSIVSPNWHFTDATFDRTAAAFNNPDHVAIVISDYRWRISVDKGDPQYDDMQAKLEAGPVITVPTITIASDFDSANAPGTAYRSKFSGKYSHRIFKGIGHNVPQEAPKPFAQAVIDVDAYG
ncbi:MAG TPA: alpha/beta hydrolase [Candidatus Acidoferrales bacterium]|jgi:pimeloyl-ACP methyl ester carboxylesterase|nr:alpha/beta hydrolase [Candidatus Acidoferrales bacterium]